MVFIDWRNRQPPGVLEDRVHRLEVRVAALTEALRVLAQRLEDRPRTSRTATTRPRPHGRPKRHNQPPGGPGGKARLN